MHPYWIAIEGRIGAGTTARSDADALSIFSAAFGPRIRAADLRVVQDMHELDQRHVVPNMGDWLKRGVWYPRGFEHISD